MELILILNFSCYSLESLVSNLFETIDKQILLLTKEYLFRERIVAANLGINYEEARAIN